MRKRPTNPSDNKPKLEKFDFEKMKLAALHKDSYVRKKIFIEYFQRFAEFPSYLFDNEQQIDSRLLQTIEDIKGDPEVTKEIRLGIDALMHRLQS